MEGQGVLLVGFFILRIVGAIVCSSKAGELNRSNAGWGIFGFFMPVIAMIIVHTLKPKIDWYNETGN